MDPRASPSPPHPTSYDSKGAETTAILIVFLLLGVLAVSLRYFTRLVLTKTFDIGDVSIGISLFFSLGTTICQIQQVKFGSGKHVQFVSLQETIESLKYLFASIITYNFTLCFTKIAILLLYRRVFEIGKTRTGATILLVFTILYGIETFFSGLFTCVPVHAFWDVKIQPTSRCVDQYKLYFANAGLNIVSDVAIVLLPIPAISKLPMSRRRKVSLIIILVLGGFVCIVSGLRLQSLVTLSKSKDPTWDQPAVAYWSAIELNVGILCACLLTLKTLISRVSSSIAGLSKSSRCSDSGEISNHPSDDSGKSPSKRARAAHQRLWGISEAMRTRTGDCNSVDMLPLPDENDTTTNATHSVQSAFDD